MTATIKIDSLLLYAYHGVGQQERRCGNDFSVSIEFTYEYCGDDTIESAINYAEVIALARNQMEVPSNLLEHVASRIATALKNRWNQIIDGRVSICKLHPPVTGAQINGVSVSVPIL